MPQLSLAHVSDALETVYLEWGGPKLIGLEIVCGGPSPCSRTKLPYSKHRPKVRFAQPRMTVHA